MKLTISRVSAKSAALIAVAVRLVLGLAVEAPATNNGAWLSSLLAVIPVGVWLLCLDGLRRAWGALRVPTQKVFVLALLAVVLTDSAVVLSAAARSAGYLALDHVPAMWLALPMLLIQLWCVYRNGDAIGYGTMILLRLLGALAILVIALQARHYRPEWLRPLLGNGWRSILSGTQRAAGWCVPPSALLFLAEERDDGEQHSRRVWTSPLLGACVAALMLALRQMMTPAQIVDESWSFRLDTLLTNGRAPLYLQLPLISLYHFGLIHLCVCEAFSASALLQRLLPSLDGWLCAFIAVAAGGLLCALRFPASETREWLLPWLFIGTALITAVAALTAPNGNGGNAPCASRGRLD